MDYRREIDGLRALAVLPVMLYHAGFRPFQGGFVGVDVFFVISGYLITTILLADLERGRFSLVDFYERRARRILPALFVVMLVCLPFAWAWLVPHDMADFSASVASVPLFLSNVLFWKTSSYFDSPADLKPLLHTWSLAVEEQYYLFFPLLLMLAWRWGRRHVAVMLLVVALASLAIAQWAVHAKPSAAFYLLPARGWELLIGALAALHLQRRPLWRPARGLADAGAAIGLALILYSVFTFDHETPFPGLHALVPTVGALLIILYARTETAVGRLLGSPLPVGVGLLSYSAYLWHQPVLAFARHRRLLESGVLVPLLLLALCLLLAYLSWRFVETPFRDRRRIGRRGVFAFGLAGSAFFLVAGMTGHATEGFAFRYTDEQRKVLAFADYDMSQAYRRYECFLEPENTQRDFAPACAGGVSKGGTVLWGDSYAAALSYGLRQRHEGLGQYTASVCPPVLDTPFPERPNCRAINDFVREEVRRLQPAVVLLHANWNGYKRHDVIADLEGTLQFLREEVPGARVVIVGSVPEWSPSLPIHALRMQTGLDGERYLPIHEPDVLAAIDARLEAVARTHRVSFVAPLKHLCRQEGCLAVTEHEGTHHLTAFDFGHMTAAGSVRIAAPLEASLGRHHARSGH